MSQIEGIISKWESNVNWVIHDTNGNQVPKAMLHGQWLGLRNAIRKSARNDAPVVICLEHGEAFLLSIIACLAEGVPFVPMLPVWPEARRAEIIHFVEPVLVINEDKIGRAHV